MKRLLRGVCATAVLALSATSGHAPLSAVQEPSARASGRSETVLADGRRLLIGGDSTRSVVEILDPVSGTTETLAVSPVVPRTWHTATLLADGSVLILGGIDKNGRIVAAPERFTLSTRTFELLPAGGFASRARHTATLLTDGRVLIAGGITGAGARDAEIWSAETEVATPLRTEMLDERTEHSARLLADGRVLLEGGAGQGRASEVFDPGSEQFLRHRPSRDADVLTVTASSPTHGAAGVSRSLRVALRFSRPVSPASVNSSSVSLVGPDGAVDLVVVPAEAGRLAFAWPLNELTPQTAYRLVVDGVVASEARLGRHEIAFTTGGMPNDADPEIDPEDWDPRTRPRKTWTMDRGDTPWRMLPPLQAAPGVTALAGQVLTLSGRPLADVSLTVKGVTTRTDNTGRFLLELPAVSDGHHPLEIDGAPASGRGRTYGYFEVRTRMISGQTAVLPYTIWMPKIDTAHVVRIASPTRSTVVITTPKIPGLELHLPPGTVVKDRQGRAVRELSITPIPVDRPPFPLPPDSDVPTYFTIQPGGAYVSSASYQPRKARLIYPNYNDLPNGLTTSFWHYDPVDLGWYTYGEGKVSGKQVVPNPGVGIYEFSGAMMMSTGPPNVAAAPGGGPAAADPVDVATGLFVLEKQDILLADVLPLDVTRTYRQGDPLSRAFGIGSSHPYAMYLYSAQMYQQADLILPDGGRIHYVRTSPGTLFQDAVFEHTTTPTMFYKSKIAWNGGGWDLTLRDGTVYVFGDMAPLQAIRDRFGNQITVEHANGQNGNVTRVVSPNGRWVEFTYDGSNRVTQLKDNINRTVGYQYDATGRLWKVTDLAGGVTEYTYDSSHRMLTVKDPRNIVYLTNTYDANGRVDTQTTADSATWEFDYTLDGNGKVTQVDVTNPRGFVSRHAFNASGYLLSSIAALGTANEQTTLYTRAATSHHVSSVTDPLGRDTEYGYNSNGKVTSITRLAGSPDEVTTTFTYTTTFDQVETVTDPLNHTTTFSYDMQGRLTGVNDPLDHDTTMTYNAAGQLLTIANDMSDTVTFGYDGGDLVSVTNPLGFVMSSFFDAAGRVVQTRDPLGNVTKYEYNASDRILQVTDARLGETVFTYDGNGNLLTLTDARNKTTTWTYDSMDRMSTHTDPLNRVESYAYNENGAISTQTDRKNQVTAYSYDALDRLIFTGFGRSGTSPTYTYASTIAATYDNGNRLTDIVDSIAGTTELTYDQFDRLTEEVSPEGEVAYEYDDAGRRTLMQVAGQTAVSYAYDDADRLTSITQGAATVTIEYDAADRRTSLTLPNSIVVEYDYDTASQLTGLTYKLGGNTLGTLVYSYNASGQRITLGGSYARTGLPPALVSATYDDASRVATWGATSFSYDDNGNLTSDGTNAYTWNARDQMAGVSGGSSASFGYDSFGRRQTKTVNGTTTRFLYDGANPVQELSGGTPTANLVTGFAYDEYFTRTDGAGVRNFLADAQGSTLALTDGSGTVLTEYTYEPFGATATTGASSTSSYGFTGREADGTGLHYYRARYYDARTQRFLSEDKIGFAAGPNLYSYVLNDPTNVKDPSGNTPDVLVWPWIGGGVTVGPAGAAGAVWGAGLAGWWVGRRLGELPIGPGMTVDDAVANLFENWMAATRTIPKPPRPKCGCSCICRADADLTMAGNLKPGAPQFAFGWATAANCQTAVVEAKRHATKNLGMKPKHIPCKCNGK